MSCCGLWRWSQFKLFFIVLGCLIHNNLLYHVLWRYQMFKGPILYCFSSLSHSCQRSNSSVFNMHRPKPIRGPEKSKSRSGELYWEQAVSVPAPLNANERRLSTPTSLLHAPLRERRPLMLAVACAIVTVDVYMYRYGSPRYFRSTLPVWPRIGPRRRGSWRSTDSAAAAGCFRMVSVSE